MAKFRSKLPVIDAVRLSWSTWSEMCEHAGVGRFEDGKPEGRMVHSDGAIVDSPGDRWANALLGVPPRLGDTTRIALEIPTSKGTLLAIEGDWVVKDFLGGLHVLRHADFRANFEEVLDEASLQRFRDASTRYDDVSR